MVSKNTLSFVQMFADKLHLSFQVFRFEHGKFFWGLILWAIVSQFHKISSNAITIKQKHFLARILNTLQSLQSCKSKQKRRYISFSILCGKIKLSETTEIELVDETNYLDRITKSQTVRQPCANLHASRLKPTSYPPLKAFLI